MEVTNTSIDTSEAAAPTPNQKKEKISETIWQVFKGLFIAAVVLAVMFNTFISICVMEEWKQPSYSHSMLDDYPYTTQDYHNILEAALNGTSAEECNRMLKEFNTKYNISYKTSSTYERMKYLRKTDPNSEEFDELIESLLRQFDISAEEITFDE